MHPYSFIILSTVSTEILCNVPFHPEWTFAIVLVTGSKNNNKIQSALVVDNTRFDWFVISPSILLYLVTFMSSCSLLIFSLTIATFLVCS